MRLHMFSGKKQISLWLVLLVIFMDWLGIGLVYPMFSSMLFQEGSPFFSTDFSWSARSWILGILLSAFSIAQFFSGPVLGALSDQKGRRPVFLLTLLIAIGGYLICVAGVVSKSLALLILGRAVVGIAAGNAGVVSATVADLSTQEDKMKNFGLYSMACGVGFAIGPFLGGQLSSYGYQFPFLFASLVVLINLALIQFFFSETHHNRKMGGSVSIFKRIHEGLDNCRKAFLVKGLQSFFGASLIFFFGWSFFYEFIPVSWIQDWGFSPEEVGIAFAYGAAIYAIGSGGLIRLLTNRFKNEHLLLFSLFGLGAMIFCLTFSLPPFSIWIYLAILNLLLSIVWPCFTTLVSNYSPKESQGETLGMFLSVQALAFAFSPLLAGPVLSYGTRFTVLTGSLAMLVASVIIYRFIRARRG